MEELKAILDTISTLGVEAKWAFFMWLAYKAFLVISSSGTILILANWIIKEFAKANDEDKTLRAIASMVDAHHFDHVGIIRKVAILKSKSAG